MSCNIFLQANPLFHVLISLLPTDDMTIEEFANSRYMRDGWVYVDGNDADGRSIVVSALLL
jgi:hypothetical protein